MIKFKNKFLIIFFLAIVSIVSLTYAFPISQCTPDPCPGEYAQGNVVCNEGTCSVSCTFYDECSDNYTTIYTDSEDLAELNFTDGVMWRKYFSIGAYEIDKFDKCYRFRQTTPNNFISSSDIDGYGSTNNFDSGIALFWEGSDTSIWYDNQYYFSADSEYIWGYGGAAWIDSCNDAGDNFDSADNFQNVHYMYCAPNQVACDDLNETYCDTDCYDEVAELMLSLWSDLENGLTCNSFDSFDGIGTGADFSYIDFVNFDSQTITMYIDEYDAIVNNSFSNTCNYWPQCDPVDPCCDQEGNFRSNGSVCKSAHDAQCTGSSSCSGIAYEDRCTGSSSTCPDNNYQITYDKACDDLICVNQSCSSYTLQPQRTCWEGTCQVNDPYDCPSNLNCLDSISCKTSASSSSDCKTGYTYDNSSEICWLDEGTSSDLIYDDNGNLISGFGFNYTYNDFNWLISVKDSTTGDLIGEYTYDADGNRIKKVEYDGGENTTTYYLDDFVQIVNSSGIYNETYYYHYNTLVGKKDVNGDLYFFHSDHLGSTALITDTGGSLVADLNYKPFGELISSSDERYTYTSHELDPETSNLYMKARYYNPEITKFTQPDKFIQNIYNPQDLNKYAYVRNNPYGYVDPDGKNAQGAVTAFLIVSDIFSAASAIGYSGASDNPNDFSYIHRLEFGATTMVLGGLFPPSLAATIPLGLGLLYMDYYIEKSGSSSSTTRRDDSSQSDYDYSYSSEQSDESRLGDSGERTNRVEYHQVEVGEETCGIYEISYDDNPPPRTEYQSVEIGGETYGVYVITG